MLIRPALAGLLLTLLNQGWENPFQAKKIVQLYLFQMFIQQSALVGCISYYMGIRSNQVYRAIKHRGITVPE